DEIGRKVHRAGLAHRDADFLRRPVQLPRHRLGEGLGGRDREETRLAVEEAEGRHRRARDLLAGTGDARPEVTLRHAHRVREAEQRIDGADAEPLLADGVVVRREAQGAFDDRTLARVRPDRWRLREVARPRRQPRVVAKRVEGADLRADVALELRHAAPVLRIAAEEVQGLRLGGGGVARPVVAPDALQPVAEVALRSGALPDVPRLARLWIEEPELPMLSRRTDGVARVAGDQLEEVLLAHFVGQLPQARGLRARVVRLEG